MSSSRSRRQVRLSRALGIPLTPKAVRYFERRPYGPGEHGRARRRTESDYAVRLKEKQRLRAQYGIREAQLQRVFEEARRGQGLTGESLVELLEMRLDALVLRAGFARTIQQARQFVVHRHILVDGKIVDRPSFRVKPGQTLQVKPKSQTTVPFEIHIPTSSLPLTDATEWGPRVITVAANSGEYSGKDRSILVWDSGAQVAPSRVSAVVPWTSGNAASTQAERSAVLTLAGTSGVTLAVDPLLIPRGPQPTTKHRKCRYYLCLIFSTLSSTTQLPLPILSSSFWLSWSA